MPESVPEPDWVLLPGSMCDGCPEWSATGRGVGHCAKASHIPTATHIHADGSIDWCMELSRS